VRQGGVVLADLGEQGGVEVDGADLRLLAELQADRAVRPGPA
jgi:hypothetical protein